MTAETRSLLIAESNRLIAARAARLALRHQSPSAESSQTAWLDSQGDMETAPSDPESTFARIVSDLRSPSTSMSNAGTGG